MKPMIPLTKKLVIMARGTTIPASLTSSDIWAAASEPEDFFSSAKYEKMVIKRTNSQINGVDLANHKTQPYGTPSSSVFKFGEDICGRLDSADHKQKYHHCSKTEDMQDE